MVSAFVGLVVVFFSVWGMVRWHQDLLVVLRGLLPLSFLFGGVVALIAGLTSMQEVKGDKKAAGSSDKKTAQN